MEAYIFDLDGTLLDSMGLWLDIDIAFLKKRGFAVPSDYADKISSMSFLEAAAYTVARFNLPLSAESLLDEWNDMAAYAYEHTVQLKPYAKEYLLALKKRGAKLAIATSAMPLLYEKALFNNGIYDWFDVICNSGEVGCGKSQPDIFLLASQRLKTNPSQCIVFEDILDAVKSAKSIGMTVCGVYDKASESDWAEIRKIADYAINSFLDAPFLCNTST